MERKDMRFNESGLKDLLGKPFIKYRCDKFAYTSSVTQIVGLYIDDMVFKLENIQESVDYFGVEEDIAVMKISESENESIRSAIEATEQIDNPVQGAIDEIMLVNENQKVYKHGKQIYDVWLTRGIIFKVDGREISFEKDTVPFSEEIYIRRGYDLIEMFGSTEGFSEGWDAGIVAKAEREIIVLK